MFQPIIAPKPTNRKLVVPTVASPFTIEENGKENVAASNIHLTYDYTSKDFVNTISQGIKTNKVSDADLLSISLISSAKKRKLYGESTNPIRTSSSSAFSRPSFDFRKGGCVHDTEEEEAEQSHLIDSIVQNATSSMPTSPAQIDVNAADNQEYIDGSGDNYDESYEDMHVENTTDLQPEAPVDQSEETEEASENWAQLRQKVGQAVLYQLLHVINNGSAEQVYLIISYYIELLSMLLLLFYELPINSIFFNFYVFNCVWL